MSKTTPKLRNVSTGGADDANESDRLDQTFFALSDPTRRAILARLGEHKLLVSEIADPFDISLQAISRHIKVLVRAGLVNQERTGRISRCSIDVGPMFEAAVWINRYSKYWQIQFDTLAGWLDVIERGEGSVENRTDIDASKSGRKRTRKSKSKSKSKSKES